MTNSSPGNRKSTESLTQRTALVCGGSSGLGFAAAQLLVESREYGEVYISSRSPQRGSSAARRIIEVCNAPPDVVSAVVIDCCDHDSIVAVCDDLVAAGARIDLLLLSSGQTYPKPGLTSQGIEHTVAASLAGQHSLTMRLLRGKAIAENARIIIAGSEAARRDDKMAMPYDFRTLAQQDFGGDVERAIESYCRGDAPAKYAWALRMVTTKLLAVYWARALAPQLPAGTTVNVVSPGTALDTNAIQHVPLAFRIIFALGGKWLMKRMGGNQPTPVAAAKYLQAAAFDANINGEFWASPPGEQIGELTRQTHEHFEDAELAQATWNVLVKITGESLSR